MYRMLIVEDEKIVREGLNDLFDWNRMGVQVAAAVESAEKALDYVSEHEIDILFTDIRLTGITGLELAKKLHTMNPELKVIITSGYNDFEYAKTAIDLDAYGFLLKPIEPEELERVMAKVLNIFKKESKERIEKERLVRLLKQSMPLLKNKFFTDLIYHTPDESSTMENLGYFGISVIPGQYTAIAIEIDDFENLKAGKTQEKIYLLTLEVLESISAPIDNVIHMPFHISGAWFCSIVNTGAEQRKNVHEKIAAVARELKRRVNDSCNLSVTVGIGKSVNKITEIKFSFKSACNAVDFKFIMGTNQIINYKDAYIGEQEEPVDDIEGYSKKILSGLEVCDREMVNKNLGILFEKLKNNHSLTNIYTRNISIDLLARTSVKLLDMNESFERIFGKETLIWDKIMRFDTIFDIQLWMHNIFRAIMDYLSKKKDNHNKKIINEILKIIEGNYSKNLTISDVSNEVYLSPNYISMIFKKETGENFTDYLIRYKLEKARQMLKETNLKVYQIGNMVGYSNISYFCSIFKNLYGVSPGEYRERV